MAVLAFGGLWGVWGVFFAIPLATLVKAIYNAWPDQSMVEDQADLSAGTATETDSVAVMGQPEAR